MVKVAFSLSETLVSDVTTLLLAKTDKIGNTGHTHSPHAGQGMNAALSDAFNLSWKLVHVLKGWAGEDLLRTVS